LPDQKKDESKMRTSKWAVLSIAIAVVSAVLIPAGVSAQERSAPKGKESPRKASAKVEDDDPHKLPDRPGTYMGRAIAPVMSYLGADWLLRDTREDEEQPEQMLDALDLKPGDVVADVGAGVGYTSIRIARRVGPTGKVYASDIQPQMIAMLKRNIRQMKLDKIITPILCTAKETKLPNDAIDLAIMVDVYHECSYPVETLDGIRKALKPGGRLVLIEFRAEDPNVPIKPEHKMTLAQARKEVEAQGFRFVKNDPRLPWQHIIIFEKPKDEAPGASPKTEASAN
jgi:ubiquinone/menaquinone biosynthesis C-methylase UbiE